MSVLYECASIYIVHQSYYKLKTQIQSYINCIMDVDSDNFGQVREFIASNKLIEKSKYIAMDLQLTGIKYDNNERDRPFDLPYEKYQKMRQVARKYNIIQIGLTFLVEQEKEVTAYPFNFYLFPRENSFSDPIVSLQAGCMEFNTNQGMDWNRWIRKGITYMRGTDYWQIKKSFENAKSFQEIQDSMDIETKLLVGQALENIQALVADQKRNQDDIIVPKYGMFFIKKSLEKYISENKLNLRIDLEKGSANKSMEKDFVEMQFIKISADEKRVLQNQKLESFYGFSLLWEQIWWKTEKKVLIGHNCFFDLLFIYESLVGFLPEYQQLKLELQERGVQMFDTKHLANVLDPLQEKFTKGTSLEQIYEYFSKEAKKPISIRLPKEFARYDLQNPALHEAGFDSYLTGWVFYQFLSVDREAVLREANRINLNNSYFYLNLGQLVDGLCCNTTAFCIEVVRPDKFVEDLKKVRQLEMKSLRDLLKKRDLLKYLSLWEGYRELFLQVKSPKNKELVVRGLVKILEEGLITNLFGLNHYFESKIITEQRKEHANK